MMLESLDGIDSVMVIISNRHLQNCGSKLAHLGGIVPYRKSYE